MHRGGLRVCLIATISLAGCDRTAPSTTDAGAGDAPVVDAPGAGDAANDAPDAAIDGPPVVEIPDTDPPVLVTVTPTGDAWLHEPIRFELDEELVAPSLTVTATIAGAPVSGTAALSADRLAIIVTLDPAARGVGTLEVSVAGAIEDDSGNALVAPDRKSTRLNSSHLSVSRMPSSA